MTDFLNRPSTLLIAIAALGAVGWVASTQAPNGKLPPRFQAAQIGAAPAGTAIAAN